MFKHLKFTSIPVENQDRALRFYTETLGFTLKSDQAYGDDRWIEIYLPDAETYFLLWKDPEQIARSQGKPSLALITGDVQQTYQELSSRGVIFSQPPTKQAWGDGMYALFTDSEGNIIIMSDS